MVIDERDTLFRTIPTKDRHASETKACGADDTVGTIRTVLCFFLSRTRYVKPQSNSLHNTYLLH